MPYRLLGSLSLLFFLAACDKTDATADAELDDLVFQKTTTPATQSQKEGIMSQVTAYGPNLCYKFSSMEIKEAGTREFEIRAKATNAGNRSGVGCAQAIYYIDTTIRINTPTTGKYLLRYYNKQQLFKTDTVQVN